MRNGEALGRILVPALVLALATSAAAQMAPAEDEDSAAAEPAPSPPSGPVHCVAEWEPSEGVLLRWKNPDLVRKLQVATQVFIPVNDEKERGEYVEWLEENDIALDNISFPRIPVDGIYTRDFGPWFVWDANNDMAVVDYTSGHRDKDEVFPKNFAALYGLDYYDSGLHHVGGNYLPNGYDVAFSSTHLYEQNPKSTREEVLGKMLAYYGIRYYPLVRPKTIWHHDTWGKPCSPDTLIVVEFPESEIYSHASANETVAYYETLESPWGRPYTIHRLPMIEKEGRPRWGQSDEPPSIFDIPHTPWWMQRWLEEEEDDEDEATAGEDEAEEGEEAEEPRAEGEEPRAEGEEPRAEGEEPRADGEEEEDDDESEDAKGDAEQDEEEEEEKDSWFWDDDLSWGDQEERTFFRPYMNSLVSNGRVYVPVEGDTEDQVALDVFQKGFPGYEIVGVDNGGTYSWDSLHCRTRNFMRRDPVRVYPYPPGDTEDTEDGYAVTAEVVPPNGSSLAEGQPLVHWSETGGEPFTPLPMEPTGEPFHYRAVLPARPHGTTVSFFVEAVDGAERRGVYPPVAPAGLMSFEVRADEEKPELSRFHPTRAASVAQWPPAVRLLAKDDMGAPEVRVEYSIDGEPQPDVVLTREERTYWYGGTLAGEPKPGQVVSFRVVAVDSSAAENTATLPKFGRVYVPLAESARVGVVDLSMRPCSGPYIAQALGELEVPFGYYEDWPEDWDTHDVWFVCLGLYADNHVLSHEEALDIQSALERGKNVYLEGGDTWCYDPEGETLNPLFGVKPLQKRGRGFDELEGEPRTIVGGLKLHYVGEDLFSDRIDAVPPATPLFSSQRWNRGRAVLHDAGTYRTIASSFSLAGLMDGKWPSTRKEVISRYLEFLGAYDFKLRTAGRACPGDTVPVRIEGEPGQQYVLLASRADYWAELPGYGVSRLDPGHVVQLAQGTIGRGGVVRYSLEVPDDVETENFEIHIQALVGEELEPGGATFTNRDVLTIRE